MNAKLVRQGGLLVWGGWSALSHSELREDVDVRKLSLCGRAQVLVHDHTGPYRTGSVVPMSSSYRAYIAPSA